MGRVMACGASDSMQKGYPNTSNAPAAEGTLAHDHAAKLLTNVCAPEDIQDPEMRKHVVDYVTYCKSLVLPHSLQGVEDEHNDGHISGHVDFFSWTPLDLTIIDLKYGFGWVDPRENWQLVTYAILVWLKHGNNGQILPPKVRLVVYQPRANHPAGSVREWVFPGENLRGYYNQIQNRVAEIEAGTATAVPGKHCRYCKAIIDCVANREYTGDMIDHAWRAERIEMAPQELAYDLSITKDAYDVIKHRLTALEIRTEETIKAGTIVPGWVIQQKTSILSWDIPDPIAAARDFGVDISKPAEAITPTQALSQGLLDKDVVTFMASRKPGGFALKRQNLDFVKGLINES